MFLLVNLFISVIDLGNIFSKNTDKNLRQTLQPSPSRSAEQGITLPKNIAPKY